MVAFVPEVILERTIKGVVMQCGYNRADIEADFNPFVKIGEDVTQFDDITKARKAFWKHVKRT